MMMTYEEVKDLVSIGAYKEGSDARIDQALALHGPILELIKQDVEEESGFDASIRKMQQALGAQGE
jgi:flagellum-specific ATP synthase